MMFTDITDVEFSLCVS